MEPLFDAKPVQAGLTYEVDTFEARYNTQVFELDRTRQVAEFVAAVAVYLKRAHDYGENEAFADLYRLQDETYDEYLHYINFDYAAARRRMFEIVNKYQLNRADRGSFYVDRWRG